MKVCPSWSNKYANGTPAFIKRDHLSEKLDLILIQYKYYDFLIFRKGIWIEQNWIAETVDQVARDSDSETMDSTEQMEKARGLWWLRKVGGEKWLETQRW